MTESIKKINKLSVGTIVGKLNGENVTKEALVNLIKDTTSPVTQSLAQISSSGDGSNAFALMDNNVTVGNLKNLVTDKPSPITLKLAQTQGDGSNAFALMDNNVTVGNLKNLVTDKPSPITLKLAQTKGDGSNAFALMDNNVTVGNLKNLVTDKPSPITLKLAQTKGDGSNAFALMDNNVTVGNLKNLVTDKPSPITLKLAQLEASGEPVLVNPESMLMGNTMAKAQLGLSKLRVGPDEMNLNQKDSAFVQLDSENPVVNPPFNNWSVNQPSVPHDSGDRGDQDLELRDLVIDGVNGYDLVQTKARNPVVNPPFNNWSVNQPSPPHATGLSAYQDLGQNIIVDGHAVHFAQQDKPTKLAQIIPLTDDENQPGSFLVKEHDANHSPLVLAQKK